MAKIMTSLHENYQSNTWGIMDAIREIGSNAIDGEQRNKWSGEGKLSVKWNARSKVLSVFNQGISVPTKALLMGTSESRDEDDCIGEFGEGLPMALKVLAAEGFKVLIYNGGEKWEPAIERSPQFENEPVLVINTRKMLKDRGGFLVEIHGIERHEYDAFNNLFLALNGDYDKEKTVKGAGSKEVLLQDCMKGMVFNKGVFVLERKDLLFGYNIDTKLNRDRSLITDYDLKKEISDLLNDAVYREPDTFAETLLDALFAGDKELELDDYYSTLEYNSAFRETVATKFRDRFGDNAIAVENMEEMEAARKLNLRGVILPLTLRTLLEREVGSLYTHTAEYDNAVQEEVIVAPTTINLVASAVEAIRFGLPAWNPEVKIVSFGGKDIEAKTGPDSEVHLASWVAGEGLGSIIKALVRVAPKDADTTDVDVLCAAIECVWGV